MFNPDHAGEFALHWYFVKSELLAGESADLLNMSQHLWRQLAQHSFHHCSFYRYLLSAENLTIKGLFGEK